MTEVDGPAENEPPETAGRTKPEDLAGLRTVGTWTVILGLVSAVIALITEEGNPPVPVLVTFLAVALTGVALRFEAAMRD